MNRVDYKDLFRSFPRNCVIFLPNPPVFTMVEMSDCFLELLGIERYYILGKGLFEVFTDSPGSHNSQHLMASLMRVLDTKDFYPIPPIRYDIPIPGTDKFKIKYWSSESHPKLDKNGNVEYIIHIAVDVDIIFKESNQLLGPTK